MEPHVHEYCRRCGTRRRPKGATAPCVSCGTQHDFTETLTEVPWTVLVLGPDERFLKSLRISHV